MWSFPSSEQVAERLVFQGASFNDDPMELGGNGGVKRRRSRINYEKESLLRETDRKPSTVQLKPGRLHEPPRNRQRGKTPLRDATRRAWDSCKARPRTFCFGSSRVWSRSIVRAPTERESWSSLRAPGISSVTLITSIPEVAELRFSRSRH